MTTGTMFAAQLARHPGMQQRIPLETMYSRHPAQVDRDGRRYVPAVHRGRDGAASIFLSPFNRSDGVLPDGRTIEYHPNRGATSQMLELVGSEVTLYAQVARQDGRQGLVRVEHPPGLPDGVFHLRVRPPTTASPVRHRTAPNAAGNGSEVTTWSTCLEPPDTKIAWADME